MRVFVCSSVIWLSVSVAALAQGGDPAGKVRGEPGKRDVAVVEAPKPSDAGRAAITSARQVATRVRGLRGPERTTALEQAANAWDKVAADFAGEPVVAGAASFAAADCWRQQGSLPLAEKDYLAAAAIDPSRFGQRGLLGAADMQRRQRRVDEAMATYGKAAAIDPGTSRAQDARLWQARLLQSGERLDDAITAFQAALESADPGSETIEASNFLALAWIAKGDLDAAARAIDHATESLAAVNDEDPLVVERLHKAVEAMSAKKALQRARDKATGAAKDAVDVDAARKRSAAAER